MGLLITRNPTSRKRSASVALRSGNSLGHYYNALGPSRVMLRSLVLEPRSVPTADVNLAPSGHIYMRGFACILFAAYFRKLTHSLSYRLYHHKPFHTQDNYTCTWLLLLIRFFLLSKLNSKHYHAPPNCWGDRAAGGKYTKCKQRKK